MKSTHNFARQLGCIVALPLVAGLIAGCSTTSGPIHVSPLPSVKSSVPSGPTSGTREVEQSISSELDQMQSLMAENSPGVARAREQVLQVHNFSEGTSLREVFLKNDLFARFDPDNLGYTEITSPIFFATTGDIMDYLQNVQKLYVSVEGSGTFMISNCVERIYAAPPNARSFFTTTRLSMLKSDLNARITYLPTGVLYVYDDHTGQQQVKAYLKSLQSLQESQQAWVGLKPAQLNSQTLNAVTSLQAEVNSLRSQIQSMKGGNNSLPSDPPPDPLNDNSDPPSLGSIDHSTATHHADTALASADTTDIPPATDTSLDPPPPSRDTSGAPGADSLSRSGDHDGSYEAAPPSHSPDNGGVYRVYLMTTIFSKGAKSVQRLAARKMKEPVYIHHNSKRGWYSVYCTADSLKEAQRVKAEASKLGYRAFYVKDTAQFHGHRYASQAPSSCTASVSHHSAKSKKQENSAPSETERSTPSAAPPAAPAPPPEPTWTLHQGALIGNELDVWAQKSGWTVVWQLTQDWSVPTTTVLSGDFQTAVTKVVTALANDGADIHAVFHSNNTVVISGTGN